METTWIFSSSTSARILQSRSFELFSSILIGGGFDFFGSRAQALLSCLYTYSFLQFNPLLLIDYKYTNIYRGAQTKARNNRNKMNFCMAICFDSRYHDSVINQIYRSYPSFFDEKVENQIKESINQAISKNPNPIIAVQFQWYVIVPKIHGHTHISNGFLLMSTQRNNYQ